eukprot:CAMPEP_0196999210 /NCGR_PEP_ID=MMETSP1380-20130617/4438_1 /TAXON_ID=5936 /ORGANISM="Euplotes crassus, Strain CT5" /LENGTH=256 /DNA_ID=CAMNT_0042416049 /DNA_START=124 /DNA_END=898 /DNA_ORIENTATION=-
MNQNVAYNLPSTKSRRSASFGYGKRFDFTKNNGSPPPTSYNFSSQFKKSPNGKAYSFGIAREAYSKVFLKGHKGPEAARDIPGPGSYNNELWNTVGKSGKAYTLRPRTGTMGIRVSSKGIPGPGSYESKNSITPRGEQFLSKFKSSGASTFNPPSSSRFNGNNNNNLPGPAEYNTNFGVSNTGGQFLSKVPTPAGRTFYHFDRNTLKNPSTARNNPGPGYYRLPSDFGYYESKHSKKSVKAKGRRRSAGSARKSNL